MLFDIEKLQKQIAFLVEVDKLKQILRKTSLIGMNRKENSAEHSWHVILSAMIFHEYANNEVDLFKVIKMLAIHDIVEIDVGDTFHYDKTTKKDLFVQEAAAAKRIFGLLDSAQHDEYMALWQEFENRDTNEAKYAAAVDRFIPFVMNSHNNGGSWTENCITVKQALDKNAHMQEGSKTLWEMAQTMLTDCHSNGYIDKE